MSSPSIYLVGVLFLTAMTCSQAQTDKYQADIPAELVKRVDAAKELQVSGNKLEEAKKELSNILSQRPDYYRALYNLGLVQHGLGQPEEALATLHAASKISAEKGIQDSTLLNSIGWIQMNQGKLQESEVSLLKALEQTPETEVVSKRRVLNNLGYLYLQKGDTARAAAYLDIAVRDYDSSGAEDVLKLVDEAEKRAVQITNTTGATHTPPPDAAQDEYINKLFSSAGADRQAGYDQLTRTDLRKDAGIPPRIIGAAQQQMSNKDGVRMAVVTLTDMSRLATQAHRENKELILKFATEVEMAQPELKARVVVLRRWLNTPRR